MRPSPTTRVTRSRGKIDGPMPTPSSLSRLAWPSLPPLPMPAFLAAMDAPRRNLTLALAASLLLHALVLAIRFTPPDFMDKARERALEVILVNSKSKAKPDKAQAKAQTNLDGGGNTDEDRRAKTPLPPSPPHQGRRPADRGATSRRRTRSAVTAADDAAEGRSGRQPGQVETRSGSGARAECFPAPTSPAVQWPSPASRARSPARWRNTTSARARSSSAPGSRNTASPSMSKTGGRRSSASATSTIPMPPRAGSTAAWC
jgi:hypothetical protein